MSKDAKRGLEPGEIWLGEPCPHGHIPYERLDEHGELETGVLERCEPGRPLHPQASGIIRMGQYVSVNTRKVESYTPLRSGPAQVASEAYRAGWDAIFAPPRGKVVPERPN